VTQTTDGQLSRLGKWDMYDKVLAETLRNRDSRSDKLFKYLRGYCTLVYIQ
jgi:hypothetical protein